MDQDTLDMIGLGSDSASSPSSGTNWESWFQRAANTVVNGYNTSTANNQNYELQKLKLQSMNPYGAYYKDGQPMMGNAGVMTPSTLLIVGAVVVAVMMLKD